LVLRCAAATEWFGRERPALKAVVDLAVATGADRSAAVAEQLRSTTFPYVVPA
jgi:hypothetical protein